MLDLLYSRVARYRRRYYQQRPHLRRRLSVPVISVGNLTVGGSSKTPLAAEIARLLLEMGERPAILSRGYGRRIAPDGAVVVSDGHSILAEVDRAGDEPLMIARNVPGAAVVVAASRYVAGALAEAQLGSTVHVLDDGFQHYELMRDVDLLVAPDTLDDVRTLPTGRFRESLDAAACADALLVDRQHAAGSPAAIALTLNVPSAFEFSRALASPPPEGPAYAMAGIARPERFFSDLERAGWTLVGRRAFPDHHHYSEADLRAVRDAAAAAGARTVVTTEKDFVRLTPSDLTIGIVPIPLTVTVEVAFASWLADRLARARRPS